MDQGSIHLSRTFVLASLLYPSSSKDHFGLGHPRLTSPALHSGSNTPLLRVDGSAAAKLLPAAAIDFEFRFRLSLPLLPHLILRSTLGKPENRSLARGDNAGTMKQRVSLDIIADDRAGQGPAAAQEDNDADQPNQVPEDSRSTSSTSSPAPADNEESDFFLGANDSQSSLGVPNLQDIQVDDECLPPVNRLPNEILISVFSKLSSSSDILHVMLTCKRWARNAVDILWHRPACSTWDKHASICQTLGFENPYFAYREFIKRLNLASLADRVNDGSVMPLAACSRVERLTLTGCKGLTDSGLIALVENNTPPRPRHLPRRADHRGLDQRDC